MAVLAVHRKEPTWDAPPGHLYTKMTVDEEELWVETDGATASPADVRKVLHPLSKIATALGVSVEALKAIRHEVKQREAKDADPK